MSLTRCLLATVRTLLKAVPWQRDGAQRGQGVVRILDLSSGNVVQALASIVNQKQVDALALQLVVVVQSLGVNDGNIALAILGNDLFGTGFDLLNQVGQGGPRLSEWNHIACSERHDSLRLVEKCT